MRVEGVPFYVVVVYSQCGPWGSGEGSAVELFSRAELVEGKAKFKNKRDGHPPPAALCHVVSPPTRSPKFFIGSSRTGTGQERGERWSRAKADDKETPSMATMGTDRLKKSVATLPLRNRHISRLKSFIIYHAIYSYCNRVACRVCFALLPSLVGCRLSAF